MKPSSDQTPAAFRPAHGALLGLLIVLTLLHLLFIEKQPKPKLWGDEAQYQYFALVDATSNDTSLLPGSLRFDQRPELNSRVYGLLYSKGWRTLRSIAGFQLFLFLAVVAFTFFQASALGLSDAGALTSACLLGLFPWFGFHVHTLWPEILHAFLAGGALCFLLFYLRSFDWRTLPASAVFLAYALFAKGVLVPFVPLIVAFIGCATFLHFRDASPAVRWARTLGGSLGYLLLVALILTPQLSANARAGHGWRLAANRWWNLELGLTLPVDAGLPVQGPDKLRAWRHHQQASLEYKAAASTLSDREELARERTLGFLDEHGTFAVVGRQLRKLGGLVLRGESTFEQSLSYRRRWGPDPPAWLVVLRPLARAMWYALLALAVAGLVLVLSSLSAGAPGVQGRLFLCLFLFGFLLALLAVPIKVRILMPLVPVLCLFAGVPADRLFDRLRAARSA